MNYVSSHWGTYKFSVDKNKKIKLDNWELDSSPTEFGLGLADAAIDNLRITQPHVRKGWFDNQGKSDCLYNISPQVIANEVEGWFKCVRF